MLGRTLLIVAMAAVIAGNNASAQEVDQATIARLTGHWLARKSTPEGTPRTILDITRFNDTPQGITVYVVRLKPQGYLVFMGDTRLPPILAFSLSNDIDLAPGPRNAFRALLHQDLRRMQQDLQAAAGPPGPPPSVAVGEFMAGNESRWQALFREAGMALPGGDGKCPPPHGKQ